MKEEKIDKIFETLDKSGSVITSEESKELKHELLKLGQKDISLKELVLSVSNSIKEQTNEFLNNKNKYGINYISGISSCIYFPSFSGNGEIKLKFIGGSRSRYEDLMIDENIVFFII